MGHPPSSRNSPREKCFSRSRRAKKKYAAWNLSTKPLELSRVLEEFDDLLQLCFCLVRSRNVHERDPVSALGEELCAALAEGEQTLCAAGPDLHAPENNQPDSDQKDPWQETHQSADPRAVFLDDVELQTFLVPLSDGVLIDVGRSQYEPCGAARGLSARRRAVPRPR